MQGRQECQPSSGLDKMSRDVEETMGASIEQ